MHIEAKNGVLLCVARYTKKLSALLRVNLLGYPDSNQERQDQNLQCYHYTIAQSKGKGTTLGFVFRVQRYDIFSILQTFYQKKCTKK